MEGGFTYEYIICLAYCWTLTIAKKEFEMRRNPYDDFSCTEASDSDHERDLRAKMESQKR
jgi:hypothetical protein